MNFHGQVVLVYLEEDNIARAYFRIKPLMTQDGPVGDTKQDFPDNGYLRIVPDRNEQHTFKERMRSMCGLCVIDLRDLPPEANKIRTNKNYNPFHGETNQYIIYSDAVRALPESMIYQVVPEGGVATASTAQVYIRDGANIQGPFRREDGQSAGESAQLPPDSPEIHSVTVNGQELLFYWPKTEIAPTAAPVPAVKEEKAAEAEEIKPAPAAQAPAEPAEEKDEAAPQPSAFDQIQALNVAPSATANRLREPVSRPTIDYVPEQPQRPLAGTRLYQTPQKQLSPRRAHNPLMEVVDRERYVGRYEAPGATLPQNTELREVASPADALKRALAGMWQSTESQKQAVDMLLVHPGMRMLLAKAVAREANDLTVAAMQSQLQELEAERLMTLMQLDDVKKNLAAAREEAVGKLTAQEQKKLDQLRQDQEAAQNALRELHQSIAPLDQKREEAAKRIEEMKNALDQRVLCAPAGQDASREELIGRVEKAFRAAGFQMEEGDALALLTALALTQDQFEICSDTLSDAQSALAVLAAALGAPLVESDWDERPAVAAGGSAPILLQYNGLRHPLVWRVSIDCVSSRDPGDSWRFPYASVPVCVDENALPGVLPAFAPVAKESIVKAFRSEIALNDEAKAVVSALRKGLREAGAPMPVAMADMICRFVTATQSELKGGVAEAIDRAVCLYVVPHLVENEVEQDDLKSLFAAMPRTLKALKACHE